MNVPNLKRASRVWQRNFDIFKTYRLSAIVGNIIEPLFILFGMGVGLGALIKEVNGLSYLQFFAPGMMASIAMTSASYECTFGAYTRMVEQKVYDGMLATPLNVADIVFGEILWGATKSLFSSGVMLVIIILIGVFDQFLVIPLLLLNMVLLGAAFSAIAISVSAVAKSYEFFNFYFTLLVTPLILFSGVYFPTERMPAWFANLFLAFPTPHAVNINHYLFYGGDPSKSLTGAIFLFLFVAIAGRVAAMLVNRRIIPEG